MTTQFTDSIDGELRKLSAEMRVINILSMLSSDQAPTDEVKSDIRHLMLVLSDLFSTSLPPIEENPVEMLTLAARDINLSRLLKERGLARVYLLTNLHIEVEDELTHQRIVLPAFMQEKNPETNQRFKSQEDFIGWFCKNAHVPRNLVFMRMRTYDRLQTVGMTMEEAFQVILKKPYASGEVLNELASWQKGELVGVDPEVAIRLSNIMMPGEAAEIRMLAESVKSAENEEERILAQNDLFEAVKPALKHLVEEVADHPSMKDAMDMVRHDIAAHPEISYWYDPEHGWIVAEYLRKSTDVRGNSYIKEVTKFNLIPELPLPQEVLLDIAQRLSVRNRDLAI